MNEETQKISQAERIEKFLKFMGEASHCKKCDQTIIWMVTKNFKRIPINGDLTAHFSNCPDYKK